jgi:hypothetical protein
VPTISHAISSSLLHNGQSPSLRRKLLDLIAETPTQPDGDVTMDRVDDISDIGDSSVADADETSRRLGQIIEERLWTMMQRSLYDPLPARRLSPPKTDGTVRHDDMEGGIVDVCIDLEDKDTMTDGRLSSQRRLTELIEDEFDDLFDDLPDEDDADFETLVDYCPGEGISDEFEDLLEDRQLAELDDIFQPTIEDHDIYMDELPHDGFQCWESVGDTNNGEILDEHYFQAPEMPSIENQNMLI